MPNPDDEISESTSTEFADDEGTASSTWQELPPSRDFFASPYDPPVKSLIQEIREKELDVRPTFQRNDVWDKRRKSRFIESILLNIPIPTLFFAEDEDGSKVVVDGQQRLLALKDFVENAFKLGSLDVLAPLNGKRFDELTPRQQRIIRNRTLRCLVISYRSDSEIRFEVFERLNTGGLPLNPQEVRHCIYRGKLNDLLHELVRDPTWMALIGRNAPHPRMNDCELVLRYFAIREALPSYAPPLKKLLNRFMRGHRNLHEDELEAFRQSFQASVQAVNIVFATDPFRRVSLIEGQPGYDRTLNRAVFDLQMLVLEGVELSWLTENRNRVRGAFEELCLSDQTFSEYVSRATADKTRLNYRLRTWAEALLRLGCELPALSRLPMNGPP